MTTYRLGIDVSHHQDPKKIDYKKLKAEGYEWVIARATYGTRPDDTFVEHCKRAKEAGLLIGGYHFYRQTKKWREQYAAFMGQLEKVQSDIVPVVDLEWNEKYDGKVEAAVFNVDAKDLMDHLHAVLDQPPIAYLAPGFFQTLKEPEWLLQFPWWVAHYTQQSEPWCPGFTEWAMWQYTGSGNVAAYDGDLDLNRARELPLLLNTDKPREKEPEFDQREAFRQIAKKHTELARIYRELAGDEVEE